MYGKDLNTCQSAIVIRSWLAACGCACVRVGDGWGERAGVGGWVIYVTAGTDWDGSRCAKPLLPHKLRFSPKWSGSGVYKTTCEGTLRKHRGNSASVKIICKAPLKSHNQCSIHLNALDLDCLECGWRKKGNKQRKKKRKTDREKKIEIAQGKWQNDVQF